MNIATLAKAAFAAAVVIATDLVAILTRGR